jgi:hypothetical protein
LRERRTDSLTDEVGDERDHADRQRTRPEVPRQRGRSDYDDKADLAEPLPARQDDRQRRASKGRDGKQRKRQRLLLRVAVANGGVGEYADHETERDRWYRVGAAAEKTATVSSS